jgi:hypothetical protein
VYTIAAILWSTVAIGITFFAFVWPRFFISTPRSHVIGIYAIILLTVLMNIYLGFRTRKIIYWILAVACMLYIGGLEAMNIVHLFPPDRENPGYRVK